MNMESSKEFGDSQIKINKLKLKVVKKIFKLPNKDKKTKVESCKKYISNSQKKFFLKSCKVKTKNIFVGLWLPYLSNIYVYNASRPHLCFESISMYIFAVY